jgi:hypothetical protein
MNKDTATVDQIVQHDALLPQREYVKPKRKPLDLNNIAEAEIDPEFVKYEFGHGWAQA